MRTIGKTIYGDPFLNILSTFMVSWVFWDFKNFEGLELKCWIEWKKKPMCKLLLKFKKDFAHRCAGLDWNFYNCAGTRWSVSGILGVWPFKMIQKIIYNLRFLEMKKNLPILTQILIQYLYFLILKFVSSKFFI